MVNYFEFFAGGGMAGAGLSSAGRDEQWQCTFSNDFDRKKSATYEANWGVGVHRNADIKTLTIKDLPGTPQLVWASFPCQDLSLAGNGAGLKGERSGTFWPFWSLMKSLKDDGRAPDVIVLENVCGTLTSHNGADFTAICETFRATGYRFGAVVVDAAMFVPQSRPRLFMIGVRAAKTIPAAIHDIGPTAPWHSKALKTAVLQLQPRERRNWIWWRMRLPMARNTTFADLIENNPASVKWHTASETKKILGMMSDVNIAKIDAAKRERQRTVGTVYKRTRPDKSGNKIQRAEVRLDEIAGCLRTPAGGSSRQVIVVVERGTVRSRLISARETARLMGLGDDYILPVNYNDAYHLTGDGVVVTVVRHLAQYILTPLLDEEPQASAKPQSANKKAARRAA
jgi:DNA (cytosine-5)-methyltransferase 1